MKDVLSLAAFAGKVLCLIVFVTALRPAGISAVQAPVRPASCSEILEDSRPLSFLAMPIRQYFVWVGSVLLVALFGADWCLPAPVAHPHSEIPANERVNLRIRSDHKWPERVVMQAEPTRREP